MRRAKVFAPLAHAFVDNRGVNEVVGWRDVGAPDALPSAQTTDSNPQSAHVDLAACPIVAFLVPIAPKSDA